MTAATHCRCGAEFRTKDTPYARWPVTVPKAARGLCWNCYYADRRRRYGRMPADRTAHSEALAENVEFLTDPANCTDSPSQLAARLGYSDLDHLKLALCRAGRKDLADRLVTRTAA